MGNSVWAVLSPKGPGWRTAGIVTVTNTVLSQGTSWIQHDILAVTCYRNHLSFAGPDEYNQLACFPTLQPCSWPACPYLHVCSCRCFRLVQAGLPQLLAWMPSPSHWHSSLSQVGSAHVLLGYSPGPTSPVFSLLCVLAVLPSPLFLPSFFMVYLSLTCFAYSSSVSLFSGVTQCPHQLSVVSLSETEQFA